MQNKLVSIGEISVIDNGCLPVRSAQDYYQTPTHTILSAYHKLIELTDLYPADRPFWMLDPGAGDGNWGNIAREIWPGIHLTGVDVRPETIHPHAYDKWHRKDYLSWAEHEPYDLIVGNPPFKFDEEFIRASLDRLRPGGVLMFLLRLGFASGQRRRDGLFLEHPYYHKAVCSKRPSFSCDGRTKPMEYAMFYWVKGWKGYALETRLREYTLSQVQELAKNRRPNWQSPKIEYMPISPYLIP